MKKKIGLMILMLILMILALGDDVYASSYCTSCGGAGTVDLYYSLRYANDHKYVCDTCGQIWTEAHSFQIPYSYDDLIYHKRFCSVCNYKAQELHYDQNDDGFCDGCGATIRAVLREEYESEYILNNYEIEQKKRDVVKISIETSIPDPHPDGAWDASINRNGSVYAWLTMNATDSTKYDLHIAGNGGVVASSATMLFGDYTNCTQITGLSNLDTSCVEHRTMYGMFYGCSSLTSLDLGDKFDTSNVMTMSYMFYGCSSLTSIPTGLDLTNIYNIHNDYGFLNLSDTLAVISSSTSIDFDGLQMMFAYCSSLTSVTINSLYIGGIMFAFCNNLTDITITSDVQGISALGNCFYFEPMDDDAEPETLLTTLHTTNSVMNNYDWSADNRVLVVPDTIAPTGTISLGSTYYEANGYKYVKSNEVTINLTASDDISEQSNIKVALINEKDYSRTNSNSGIKWLSFSPSIQWTASSGKGLKRVYVIFKDEAGNQSLYLAT